VCGPLVLEHAEATLPCKASGEGSDRSGSSETQIERRPSGMSANHWNARRISATPSIRDDSPCGSAWGANLVPPPTTVGFLFNRGPGASPRGFVFMGQCSRTFAPPDPAPTFPPPPAEITASRARAGFLFDSALCGPPRGEITRELVHRSRALVNRASPFAVEFGLHLERDPTRPGPPSRDPSPGADTSLVHSKRHGLWRISSLPRDHSEAVPHDDQAHEPA
jgi:hypothetical protein